MNKNKFFILFANCIPVKGFRNIILCDLQRNTFYKINQGLYEIMTKYNTLTIGEIMGVYDNCINQEIESQLKKLIDLKLGFISCNSECFPRIKPEWKSASKITNCIIELDNSYSFDINKVLIELTDLNCNYLELRYYYAVPKTELRSLLNVLDTTSFFSVDIYLKYSLDIENWDFNKLFIKQQRVSRYIVHSSPYNKSDFNFSFRDTSVHVIVQKITDNSCCGLVSSKYFEINLRMYSESKNFNSCLNRKISITESGEIKNCPSMPKSYGNIKNMTLKDALAAKDFKDVWKIKKDEIKICQDCEFRYICTDCRAFIDDPSDIYSHPAKCSYNPYQAKWKGEDGYIPVTDMTEKQISKLKSTAN